MNKENDKGEISHKSKIYWSNKIQTKIFLYD